MESFHFKISLCRRTLASESDSFRKISFQTLIFNEKVCNNVMPFKTSTKSEQLVVLRGPNRVKTLFLRCHVFIEIWFLNENWIQNLNFKKISLRKTIIGKSFSKSARTKNSRFKNLSSCRKKLHFKNRIFFPKIPFQTLIFNEKACFKIMPFKISTKSEKNCCFLWSKLSQNVFFQMWIFDRNLISQ